MPEVVMDRITISDLIQGGAMLVAMLGVLIALISAGMTRRQSLRVEKSTAYLSLEIASSDVFKYEAEKATALAPYQREWVSPQEREKLIASPDASIAYNLYFQTLNLFEACTRFRRQNVIEHEVFASWVAWFYDTLDDWYFRDQWHELRSNYTGEVREIFDGGVRLFARLGKPESDAAEAIRKRAFYELVCSETGECTAVKNWIDELEAPFDEGKIDRLTPFRE